MYASHSPVAGLAGPSAEGVRLVAMIQLTQRLRKAIFAFPVSWRRVFFFQTLSKLVVPVIARLASAKCVAPAVSEICVVIPRQIQMAVTAEATFAKSILKQLPHFTLMLTAGA